MKTLRYIKVLSPFLLLAGIFIFKYYYLDEVSDRMAGDLHRSGHQKRYEQFDLTSKVTDRKGTLLEFGATNCSACRRMEKVLEKIKREYSDKIDIQFINTTRKEGLLMGRDFGIIAIPMQVLLDTEGRVVFKHTGYIAPEDLSDKIDDLILRTGGR